MESPSTKAANLRKVLLVEIDYIRNKILLAMPEKDSNHSSSYKVQLLNSLNKFEQTANGITGEDFDKN